MNPLAIFGPRTGHPALFADLCRYHDLDRKMKQLLQSVMDKFKPDQPALVFVDPTWLRRAMETPDFQEHAEVLQELYNNWFGAN